MRHLLLNGVVAGILVALSGCASSPAPATQRVSAKVAGKAQTVKTGTVVSVKPCVIEGDPGPTYPSGSAAGARAGTIIATGGSPTVAVSGAAGAVVGGAIGRAADKKLGERPGQMIEIQLDDGSRIVVVQDAEPAFVGNERIKVLVAGDDALVVLDEPDQI